MTRRKLTEEQEAFEETMGLQVAWPDEIDLENPKLMIAMDDTDLRYLAGLLLKSYPKNFPHYFEVVKETSDPLTFEIQGVEGEETEIFTIDEDVMLKGLKLWIQEMYPYSRDKFKWLSNAMKLETYDAEMTFVILNYGLFGTNEYGWE